MKLYEDQWIVITGGAGFIGSCMVRYLNDLGMYNLVIVDELGTDEKWKNLVGKKFVDIIPKDQLFNWLAGKESQIEAFVHLGACSDTMETDATYLLENNYRYSVKLAEYALKHGHRFIYASSAATYGDGSKGFVDNQEELDSLEPLNMYGYSKQLFDQWVLREGILDQIVGLKYFNVFGPNEAHKDRMASAITRMVPRIQKGEPVFLFKSTEPDQFADGEQKRDFIYVKDAVRMTSLFLTNDAGGIYNIGSGLATTWNQLARAVFRSLDREPKIEYIDMPADLVKKYQNYSRAEMSKTTRVLGDKVKCMDIHDSVEDYVKNYLIPEKKW